MKLHNTNHTHKKNKVEKTIIEEKAEKLTIPEIYPDNRLLDSKTPIASYTNVEDAKEWVEFNKL